MSAAGPYTDRDGEELRVRPSSVDDHTAVLVTEGVHIPAHRLAEVVAAMYEAAGQPVPDLPVIHDTEQVKALAALLHKHGCTARQQHLGRSDEDVAQLLLADGVRLPEATDA